MRAYTKSETTKPRNPWRHMAWMDGQAILDELPDRASEAMASAREVAVTTYERAAYYAQTLPAADRLELLYFAGMALIGVGLLLWLCARLRECCVRCCGTKRPDRAYVRLERARDELSAQWGLWCRCSLKWCWLQIPVPYVSFACRQPRAGSATNGALDPIVTELVALTVRGEWSGPVMVWLTGVDALQPAWMPGSPKAGGAGGMLAHRSAGGTPSKGAWTQLHVAAASGGGEDKLSTLSFDEPVRLRAGFGCRLAVQLEPRTHLDGSSVEGADFVGAGRTTVRVFDHEPLPHIGSPVSAALVPYEDVPVVSPSSRRALPASPRDSHTAYERAPSMWRDVTGGPAVDPMGPASNSSRTARVHQIHGALSPTTSSIREPFGKGSPL